VARRKGLGEKDSSAGAWKPLLISGEDEQMDLEKSLTAAIEAGIKEGVKARLTSQYGDNPLTQLIGDVLKTHGGEFRSMLDDALSSAIGDAEFREEIRTSVRHILAKTLVARFGGELEKQINILKSDPVTRARITLAIEEIVKERCTA
jgi:hypothetical protein